MKRNSFILMVVFLITTFLFVWPLPAQEKTKEEQDKEVKIQQAIDEQKKEMAEQFKDIDVATKVLKAKQAELENTKKDVRIEVEKDANSAGEVRMRTSRGERSFSYDDPFNQGVYGYTHSLGGDNERTTWDFSKSVKESTFSRDYAFDVEKTVKTVVMSIMGDCKAGEIKVKILMPGGKTYSEILIDESGNLNWRKSFNISAEENKEKAGEWIFKISADKATGFFKISLQAY